MNAVRTFLLTATLSVAAPVISKPPARPRPSGETHTAGGWGGGQEKASVPPFRLQFGVHLMNFHLFPEETVSDVGGWVGGLGGQAEEPRLPFRPPPPPRPVTVGRGLPTTCPVRLVLCARSHVRVPPVACAMPPQVWERIVHYAECTEEELREVVEILLQLVDGTTDTMPFSFCRQPTMALMMSTRSFGGAPGPSMDRYEFSEQNQHIMKCKVAACRWPLCAPPPFDAVCPARLGVPPKPRTWGGSFRGEIWGFQIGDRIFPTKFFCATRPRPLPKVGQLPQFPNCTQGTKIWGCRNFPWPRFPLPPPPPPLCKALLADHNSVITPGMGTEVPTPHDDLPPTARAREMETAFLMENALADAWATASKPSLDPKAHHIPKGWTWGFHTDKQTSSIW